MAPVHQAFKPGATYYRKFPEGFGNASTFTGIGQNGIFGGPYNPPAEKSVGEELWQLSLGEFPLKAMWNWNGNGLRQFPYSRNVGDFQPLIKKAKFNLAVYTFALANLPASDSRTDGPWEDTSVTKALQTGAKPSPQSLLLKKAPVSLSSFIHFVGNERENKLPILALTLARQGQKLEPNNSYFDWVTAKLLFFLNRDDEAIETLIKANHKTGFALHWREFIHGGFADNEKVKPVFAEEKAYIITSVRRPASFTHVVNMALWKAMQSEEQGDKNRALQIHAALARLLMVMNARSPFWVDQANAATNLRQVWTATDYAARYRALKAGLAVKPSSIEENHIAAAQYFRAVAGAQSRSDIVSETTRFEKQIGEFWNKMALETDNQSKVFTNTNPTVRYLRQDWRFAELALCAVGLTLGLWLLFFLVGPYRGPSGQPVPHLQNRHIAFPLVLSAVLFGLNYWWGVKYYASNKELSFVFERVTNFSLFALPICAGGFVCARESAKAYKRNASPESHRSLGLPAEQEATMRLFWSAQKVLWFRFLPFTTLTLSILYLLSLYPLQVPRGLSGEWINLYPAIPGDPRIPLGLAFAAASFALAFFLRWRVCPFHASATSPSQRAALFAGYFAFRRILAWMIPLGLWMLVISMSLMQWHRGHFETQIEQFLMSETQP